MTTAERDTRLHPLGDRLVVRQYLAPFERRFTHTSDATLFLEEDGSAVRLPDGEAARIVAAMRATLFEADAAAPRRGREIVWPMLAAAVGASLLGGGIGLPGQGCALALPAATAVFLLGPGLSALQLDAAWRRGMAGARAAMAPFERVSAGEVRGTVPRNWVRPALEVVALLTGAVILGLIAAYVTMPFYGRIGLDRALARAAPSVLFPVIVLVFAARATDLYRRRPMAEGDVTDAWDERRGRPFR